MKWVVKTPIMLPAGYLDWVYSWRVAEGEQFLMLGNHSGYCPVIFERYCDAE